MARVATTIGYRRPESCPQLPAYPWRTDPTRVWWIRWYAIPTRMGQVKCYTCGNFGHMASDCSYGKSNTHGQFRGGPRGGYRGPQRANHQSQSLKVHVNLCSTMGPPMKLASIRTTTGKSILFHGTNGNFIISRLLRRCVLRKVYHLCTFIRHST